MNFIICPNCQGKTPLKKCPTCNSREIYAWFGGYVLFLDKIFNRAEIISNGLKRFLKVIIRILLILFGVWGLVCLFKIVLNLPEVVIPEFIIDILNQISYLNISQEKLFLYIWFSILTDCYLFYTLEKEQDQRRKNWPKSTRENVQIPENWEETDHLAKRFKIDVAQAFSKNSVKVMQKSWALAHKLKHHQIQPIHIFASCLEDSDVRLVINRLGLNWKSLQDKVARALSKINRPKPFKNVSYSLETQKVLLKAYVLAGEGNSISLSPLEILQVLISFEGSVKEIFYDLEVGLNEITNVCLWIKVYQELSKQAHSFAGQARFKPKGPINRAYTAIATPNLDVHGEDLTQMARSGYLGVCMDREKEIKEIFRVLEGGRPGVVLVGQPGVGKTTIINGLARRMVTEDVPEIFQDKRLVSLSLASLIAGASRSGEIEQRLQVILSEVARSGNIILVIKDIHNMVGVRTTEGELDVSEILSSILKRRLFLVLATSIPSEYRRLIETKALGEVFQKVKIEEPDQNATIQILEAQAAPIEARERVYFSYGALNQAVDLSSRYLHEQFLPDKAINLLKEVAIAVKNKKGRNSIIQSEDVAALVAEKTNIPVTKLTEKESTKLLNLEEQIHKRLIDQNEAVNMVSSALRRARTELRSQKKPIVNLLFLGPTGVGKTELAKTVTEVYFGQENRMIRLDMSEYQEKGSINRLIGVPGGEKGGLLTEAVRLDPSSLLLLDEIEKAHPDILNVFLQVMDDGRLTDALGRTIDFTNLIIICTSNAGTDFIQEEITKGTSVEMITEILIQEKLKPYFRPEFLNRFDGTVVFKPLGMEEIKQITRLLLRKLTKQLEEKGITLKATNEAITELAEAGFDPAFGARPLRRAIQNRVSDVLAKLLLTKKIGRRDIVILEKGGKVRVEKAQDL
ncbi:ATP-dependent Clp protease ATP-binding subunit [Patescibacteria group bacterium]|nr:ATP-dependent Clp protease ATP-binding subunit [Patescibacteria group bacterium]